MINTNEPYERTLSNSSCRYSMTIGMLQEPPTRIINRLIEVFVPPDRRRPHHRKLSQ